MTRTWLDRHPVLYCAGMAVAWGSLTGALSSSVPVGLGGAAGAVAGGVAVLEWRRRQWRQQQAELESARHSAPEWAK